METLTAGNFITLAMLLLLQLVLGFDNLLYISLESQNAPKNKQKFVRHVGIGLAIFLRIGLLFLLLSLFKLFQNPIFSISLSFISGDFTIHNLIILAGGMFIIYVAIKEIWHMISLEENYKLKERPKKSVSKVIMMMVIMNVVFSFDSILSALALTDVPWVMITAIVVGGLLMIWLSDKVANFLKKNRMYEVLGLFILFLVGVMLLTEGGHSAHLTLFGTKISAMNKTTFYFIIVIIVVIEIIQSRYKKKLTMLKEKNTQNSNEDLAEK